MLTAIQTKTALKTVAGWAGVDVSKKRDILRFLPSYGIETVLDIGANTGQFAASVRRLLPAASIHSFEPLPHQFARLMSNMGGDPLFAGYAVALGREDKRATMYANEFSPSSSLLPMTEKHVQAFPKTAHTSEITVEIQTLDSWARDKNLKAPLMIKMDVQGYEGPVIAGGHNTISSALLLLVEVSFCALYRGQELFGDIYDRLRGLGFQCAGMIDNIYDPDSGRILSADALFLRPDAS